MHYRLQRYDTVVTLQQRFQAFHELIQSITSLDHVSGFFVNQVRRDFDPLRYEFMPDEAAPFHLLTHAIQTIAKVSTICVLVKSLCLRLK